MMMLQSTSSRPMLRRRRGRFAVQLAICGIAAVCMMTYLVHEEACESHHASTDRSTVYERAMHHICGEPTTLEAEDSQRQLRRDRDPYRFMGGDALITYPYNKSSRKWAILFHLIGICYMIFGLNVVCDAYFCEALTAMVDAWEIQEDVAGATFMAAGGSAPELFTSIMGVFVARSDVGFGTIVGSAVFNVLFVIGLCGTVSSVPLALTWWPLFRDCSYYIMGLGALAIFVEDEQVKLYEALILFMMYIGYCVIMYFNSDLEKFVKKAIGKHKVAPGGDPENPEENSAENEQALVQAADAIRRNTLSAAQQESLEQSIANLPDAMKETHFPAVVDVNQSRLTIARAPSNVGSERFSISSLSGPGGANGETTSINVGRKHRVALRKAKAKLRFRAAVHTIQLTRDTVRRHTLAGAASQAILAKANQVAPEPSPAHAEQGEATALQDSQAVVEYDLENSKEDGAAEDSGSLKTVQLTSQKTGAEPQQKPADSPAVKPVAAEEAKGVIVVEENNDGAGDDDDDGGNPFFTWLEEDTLFGKVEGFLEIPVTGALYLCVPDCTKEEWKPYFLSTFGVSLLWIALFSYFLVWWATIVGDIIGIPTVVMGLTILAAGTSIPDAISSVVMAKLGEGDMAVSSSIGSNVFDILVGLPVPWIILTGIVEGGDGVATVRSPYLVVNVLVLLLMVVAVVISIHHMNWVLSKELGVIMGVLYAIFLVIAIFLESAKPVWARI